MPISPELKLFARRLAHYKTMWRFFSSFMRGLGKFLKWWAGWVAATDKNHLIAEGTRGHQHIIHDNWCRFRRAVSFIVVILVALLTVVTLLTIPVLIIIPIILTVAALTSWGRPEDKTLVVEKEQVPHKPIISGDTIRQIVASAVKGMKADEWSRIRVLGPGVVWDRNHVWWAVRLQMPGTLPGSAVVRAYEGMMTGIGVGRSQLIIKVHPQNEAVVTIMGTEIDPWSKPPIQTPIMKMETTSVWEPVPIGLNRQDKTVYVSIVMTAWLIGAIPRMGKTNLMALFALWIALDPDADMAIFSFKASADWRMFESIAVAFGEGRAPVVFQRLVEYLQSVVVEIDRRGEVLGQLASERLPEGQVTRELAEDPTLGLRPIFIFIDEVHWGFKHKVYGRKIMELVEDIAKTGQFVGVYLLMATQRPDTDSIPSSIRDVCGTRAAGKCLTRQSSTTILGTAAYDEGWDAARLPRKAGIFIIYGADDTAALVEAQDIRVHRCDAPQRQMLAWKAAAMRDARGRLPNQIDSLTQEEPILLRRVREIQADRPYVLTAELLETLNAMPEYAEEPWDERTLATAMKTMEFSSEAINRDGQRGRRGYNVVPAPSPVDKR